MSEIRYGEFWLTDTDDLIYCDGDAGYDVPNHEAVVKAKCLEIIRDHVEQSRFAFLADCLECEDGIPDIPMISENVSYAVDVACREGLLTEEEAYDIWGAIADELPLPVGVYGVLFDGSGSEDPREYAIEHWGWIRIVGKNAQAYRRNPRTVRRIAQALYEGYGDLALSSQFNVEFMAPREIFWEVPYEQLEKGAIREISTSV